MGEALEIWLKRSRAEKKCFCEKIEGRWLYCPYHQGAVDAWYDAWEKAREIG